MLTGKEFNKQYNGTVFIKLVNDKSIHNGFYFGEGLNICTDLLNLDENDTSCIYFYKFDDLSEWLDYNGNHMTYIFDVAIPNDATVLIMNNKMKCNKFILSNKRLI